MLKQIIRIVSDGLVYICLVLSTIIEVILFSMPIERMNILQHIITYASCNLALVGFIFSLMLGLKGGTIYTQLIKDTRILQRKYIEEFSMFRVHHLFRLCYQLQLLRLER